MWFDQVEDEDEEEAPAASDAGDDAPADDDKGSDADDAPSDDAGDDSAPQDAPAVPEARAPSVPAPSQPVDKDQAIRDFIAGQYAKASDDSKVNEALENAKAANRGANMEHGLETMFTAGRVAVGGPGADDKFYDAQQRQGQQGVQQAMAQREQKIRDFVAQQQLGNQAVASRQESQMRQLELDAGDPSSKRSQVARAAFQANFPDVADSMGDDFDNLTSSDLGKIGQITDTKAKIDAAKQAALANKAFQAAMLQNKNGQKDEDRDITFNGKFQGLQQKYNTASADLDKQDQMIQQAEGSAGGIAGSLVKGGALHEALGRVSQGELGMAQDPGLMNRAQALFMKIDSGATLTPKDIAEYKAINAANRAATESAFQASAQQLTDGNDRARKLEPGTSAKMVGFNPAPKKTAAAAPPPETKVIKGITYQKVKGGWKKVGTATAAAQ